MTRFNYNPVDSNKTYKHLKHLNSLIKKPSTSKEGFLKLQKIDLEKLTVGLQLYATYLKGKYYKLCYKNSEVKNLEDLERANEYFDEVIYIARENNIKLKNPKYKFIRANTKFELSIALKNAPRAEQLRNHAIHLTQTFLKYKPNDETFNWLLIN